MVLVSGGTAMIKALESDQNFLGVLCKILTSVDCELNDLSDLSAESVLDSVSFSAAVNLQFRWWFLLGASRVDVTVALIAADRVA